MPGQPPDPSGHSADHRGVLDRPALNAISTHGVVMVALQAIVMSAVVHAGDLIGDIHQT